jgi:LPXTG-motif cell wall-anchored protein
MTADEAPQPEITVTTTPLEVPERFAAEPVGEPAFVAEPPVAEEPVAEPVPLPAELPRTASPLPFVAVGGLTLLFAGLGLGLLRRRAG